MPNPREILPVDKYTNEKLGQSIDFQDVMEAGETITSRDVKIQDANGADVTGTLLDGAITGSGSLVVFTLHQGTAGLTYWVDTEVTLNTGEIHNQRMRVFIPEPATL